MKRIFEKIRKSRQKLKSKSNKGFTLVELLVAMVILSVVIFPTLQVFVTATKVNANSRARLQANITGDSVLESAKSFSLYSFNSQCVNLTSASSSKFSLVAGAEGRVDALKYAGGTIAWDENYTFVPADYTTDADGNKVYHSYMYAINKIRQSKSYYDAVIVFQEVEYTDASVTPMVSEEQVSSVYSYYNKKFDITVYVYKHSDDPVYIGATDLSENAVVVLTGSKLDSGNKFSKKN
jgi:prepilin-type N-terminal cleavage/methylation domain-containing protein